ncbi:hypothetical protein [Lactobacillus sp. ESL0228]|uniref:hypothetical protein n=1 Tax=Lactobacillus sp. ESL0228 TaxID=2069352 RepID=UPI000EFBA816|nr:hypothetical protein [Lactobacillus sp. ESL0228]RMC47563.1 hypothetical protein F5ESL0228_06460 [Lactobacillus sp. ESL0228]
MKKSMRMTVISAAVSLFSVATGAIATLLINSFSKKDQSQDKHASKQLARAGYTFKLSPHAVMYQQAEKQSTFEKKDVEQLIEQKTLFKIIAIKTINNTVMAHIIDQSGEHHGWVNLVSDLYNIKALKQGLKPLVEVELNLMRLKDNAGKQIALKQLPQVQKEIQNLSPRNKQIGEVSLRELMHWLEYDSNINIPSLLIGKYIKE